MFVSRDKHLHPNEVNFWRVEPANHNGNFSPHLDMSDPDVWLGMCSVDLIPLLRPDIANLMPEPGCCVEIPDPAAKTCQDVKAILQQWLEANGYDGLWNADGECACKRDDLVPCGGPCDTCQPGYLRPCDCGEHNWHIGRERPVASNDAEKGEVEP